MDYLVILIDKFWEWTKLPENCWWNTDIEELKIDFNEFPQIGEICNICIKRVNSSMTDHEMNLFLMGLAIDSEDEDILDACIRTATPQFLQKIISKGMTFPQSSTRWQLVELIRQRCPHQHQYLKILCDDTNAYVSKRAYNAYLDINTTSLGS